MEIIFSFEEKNIESLLSLSFLSHAKKYRNTGIK